jgi:thiamine kinase-like enzyme
VAHPLAARICPPVQVDRLLHVWEEREAFLRALDRLPRAFCHRDLNPANIFLRSAPRGGEEVVAIDWEGVGSGAVGEDLAPLMQGSILWHRLPLKVAEEIDAHIFTSYLNG